MDENENNNIEEQLEQPPGSGSVLAAARKSQNRTVEEIADELNLSVSQIKTIELDQTEGLPEPTYVRGYIRSYAKLLNLDPEKVLGNYLNPNWQKSTNLEDMPRDIGSNNISMSESSKFWTPAKVIVLLAISLSAAFLWYSGMLNDFVGKPNQSSSAVSSAPAIVKPETAQLDEAEKKITTADQNETLNTELSLASDSTQDQVNNQLLLNFVQTSWVDIRDAQDNRLAYKSYAKGEQLDVTAAGSMSVFIGNAEGVTAIYNGVDYDLTPHREGVYAKFTVGEDPQ